MKWKFSILLIALLKFRLLRRYRKIMGDSRLTATGDRGHHSTCNYHAAKLLSYNSFYLLLAPSIYKASVLAKVE